MIGRNTSHLIFLALPLFSILLFAQNAFAQNPTGREAPKPAKEAPKPAKKEKSKPVVRGAQPGKPGKPSQSGKLGQGAKSGQSGKSTQSGKGAKSGSARSPAAKSTQTGAMLTIVAPPGAAVEVDGKPRGVVGVDGDIVLRGLAPGDHQLNISADGYEPCCGTFVMSVASTRFEAPMRKKLSTGRLALTANEPGTEILIDEKYGVKTLPGQVMRVDGLLPGVRQLRAIKPGFREWRGTVTVKANETVAVNVELKPLLDPEMLRIPEGAFVRGNDKGAKDQRPAHQAFTPVFEISRNEVTNRLYKIFVDATNRPAPRGVSYGWNGNNYPAGQDDLPVVFVTWEDAVAFCKWLSEQTGNRYRLPTEAEWEKAAKLGGDKYTSAGRVWEWCSDWHSPDYYKLRERIDPQGPARGKRVKMLGREGEVKVIRGGGFGLGMVVMRAAERGYFFPAMTRFDIGFRVVREVSK
ncbi:MAG: SUMF1/EgtB/PvdO family nonheme iron enzyme [Blastocatellia bacterium]